MMQRLLGRLLHQLAIYRIHVRSDSFLLENVANALVGGNKVVLNPLSVSGEVGINVAGGIADIDLVYVVGPPPMIRERLPIGRY